MKAAILILILISLQICNAETTITGKILGWDGEPEDEAGITIIDESNIDNTKYIKADKNANYEISLNDNKIYTLKFSATNHNSYEFKIITLDYPVERTLDIMLEPYIYDKNSIPVILGSFNDWDFDIGVIQMQKAADGKYYAELPIENGEVRYQIMNILKGKSSRSINGSMHDSLIFDNDGDYESIVKYNAKKVKIEFDPRNIAIQRQELQFLSISPELLSQINLNEILKNYSNDWRNQFLIAKMNKDSLRADSVRSAAFVGLEQLIEKQTFDEARLLAYLEYLQNINTAFDIAAIIAINPNILKSLFELIPAKSDIWLGYSYSIYTALHIAYSSPTKSEFFQNILTANNNDEFKVKFLFDALRMSYQLYDKESNVAIYNIIKEKYPEHKLTKKALREFSPYKRIAKGNKLPKFTIKNSLDTTQIITNSDLMGKYVLIDFWASWCGPCVMEIPLLQSIYEEYQSKGLEILSISLDEDIEAPRKFASGRFKISWLNTWQGGQFDSEISEIFEIINIPTLIFVNKEGIIIEINGKLYGEDLETFIKEQNNAN